MDWPGRAVRANARRAGCITGQLHEMEGHGFKLFHFLFMSLVQDLSYLHVKEFAAELYSFLYLPKYTRISVGLLYVNI